MLPRLFTLLLLLLGLQLHAASQPPLIETIGGETPLSLESLNAHIDVAGSYAVTTLDLVLRNPNSRVLEGNLQLPLLPGQQVIGFALDFDGTLRYAVPVEKAKGRQVFEAVERQRVDPGLLEATQGNQFRLRVYPIPARGTRSVQIRIGEALGREAGQYRYRLPLEVFRHVDSFTLDMSMQTSAMPSVSGSLGKVAISKVDGGYAAKLQRRDFAAQGQVLLQWAAEAQPQVYTRGFDGEQFFVAEIPLAEAAAPRVLPKVVGLLWDSSASAVHRQIGAELAMLDQYFRVLGNGEVRLTRLRDVAEPVQRFKIENGRWDALREALKHTVYDGATALDGWTPERDVGEYLLFSDGLVNYGKGGFPTLAAQQALFAVNSASTADTLRLTALTAKYGGRLVQLPNMDGIDSAARQLLNTPPKLVGMSATSAEQLVAESPYADGGMLRVAGVLRTRSDVLRLRIATARGEREISVPLQASSAEHDMAATLWAQYQVQALQANRNLNRAAIRRIGLRFALVNSETSLLVLDSVADYLRYDIVPPSELRQAYEAMKADRNAVQARTRTDHLESVVRDFAEKRAWWEKSWPKSDMPLAKDKKEKPAQLADQIGMVRAMEAAPAPPPMPAPSIAMNQAPESLTARPAAAPKRAKSKADSPDAAPASIGIALKPWRADTPYLTRMRAAPASDIYAIYLDEKASFENSSAFYLDVADLLLEKGQSQLGLRVLSNLAEMDLENRQVLRILGYRLLQAGAAAQAIPILEQVRELAQEEPQSFRDLAQAYAAVGRHQDAVEQLSEVVTRSWDGRFPQIELIALAELNAIVAAAPKPLDTSRLDPRLLKNLDLDLRVVMTWDADASDMDLWVTDPNGEKCFYGHALTYQGGRMSRDFTGGYGPEEFSLRHAKPGKYKVETNFYGNTQQVVAGATTLQLKFTTGFGRAGAKEQNVTLRLKERKETVFVGEFDVK